MCQSQSEHFTKTEHYHGKGIHRTTMRITLPATRWSGEPTSLVVCYSRKTWGQGTVVKEDYMARNHLRMLKHKEVGCCLLWKLQLQSKLLRIRRWWVPYFTVLCLSVEEFLQLPAQYVKLTHLMIWKKHFHSPKSTCKMIPCCCWQEAW